jgi:hypothetical protein
MLGSWTRPVRPVEVLSVDADDEEIQEIVSAAQCPTGNASALSPRYFSNKNQIQWLLSLSYPKLINKSNISLE